MGNFPEVLNFQLVISKTQPVHDQLSLAIGSPHSLNERKQFCIMKLISITFRSGQRVAKLDRTLSYNLQDLLHMN